VDAVSRLVYYEEYWYCTATVTSNCSAGTIILPPSFNHIHLQYARGEVQILLYVYGILVSVFDSNINGPGGAPD